MGLFGPLGDTRLGSFDGGPAYGGANLFGVDAGALGDDAEYIGSQRRQFGRQPNWMLFPYTGTGVAATNANTTPSTPAATPQTGPGMMAPPPSMQTLGSYTTRRTELFGPLASVAI
jgi:hypothetical protein